MIVIRCNSALMRDVECRRCCDPGSVTLRDGDMEEVSRDVTTSQGPPVSVCHEPPGTGMECAVTCHELTRHRM